MLHHLMLIEETLFISSYAQEIVIFLLNIACQKLLFLNQDSNIVF